MPWAFAIQIIILCAFAFQALAEQLDNSVYTSKNNKGSTAYEALALPTELSIPDYVNKLKKHKIDNVNDALGILPPAFLRNFTLVYKSNSLQSASYIHPRAILFGNTAQSILTFNGHSKQAGYDSLETVSVENNKIVFREIQFKPKQDSKYELEYLDRRISVSKANPNKCMGCHRTDFDSGRQLARPRYFWGDYDQWNGVYGSLDDHLSSSPDDSTTKDEFSYLQDFKKQIRIEKNSRYKNLVFESNEAESPYYYFPNFKEIKYPHLHLNKAEVLAYRNFDRMPNSRLAALLAANYSFIQAQDFLSFVAKNQWTGEQVKVWACYQYSRLSMQRYSQIESAEDVTIYNQAKSYIEKHSENFERLNLQANNILKNIGFITELFPATEYIVRGRPKYWNTGYDTKIFSDNSLQSLFYLQVLWYSHNLSKSIKSPAQLDPYAKKTQASLQHLSSFGLMRSYASDAESQKNQYDYTSPQEDSIENLCWSHLTNKIGK